MKLRLRQFLDYDDTYSLKGIAMLMIIIGHAFNGYPGTDTGYFYPAWLDCLHMELWAAMGVSIFFFLSGYGMFLALDKRQGSIDMKYVISKVRKLFVPLLVYWCIEIVTHFQGDIHILHASRRRELVLQGDCALLRHHVRPLHD